MTKENIILGIDPGTNILGYGLIEIRSSSDIRVISMGVLKLGGISDHAIKLQKIFKRIESLITEFHPDEMAIEAPFFGKNVQSMLKLGRAQGVCIAAALAKDIPVAEYSPKTVKLSITGNGNASKEQVASMIEKEHYFKTESKYMDATDGLAVALCHHYQSGKQSGFGSKASGWKAFLKNNPDRLA